MDRAELLRLYDQDLRIDITYPDMRKEVLPGLVRFIRPAPGKNYILYSTVEAAALERVAREQIAFFTSLGQPFEWISCTHDALPDLHERLRDYGFQPDDEDPAAVMVLDLAELPPSLAQPATANIRPVTDRAGLEGVIQVEQQVWGQDFGWMRQRMGDHLEIPGYLSVYLAYVDDEPASAAWLYFHQGSRFASLYGGSTIAARRGQGLYTALLAARAREALRRGYRFLCVEAGPMSRPILARHGFQLLTQVYSCEWQGRGVPGS